MPIPWLEISSCDACSVMCVLEISSCDAYSVMCVLEISSCDACSVMRVLKILRCDVSVCSVYGMCRSESSHAMEQQQSALVQQDEL
jgi:hypothetical protein